MRIGSGRLAVILAAAASTFGLAACSETSIGSFNVEPPNPPQLEARLRVDRAVQTPVPAVDVLWVIDNSRSMAEEQRALSDNFNSFMRFFLDSGLDYHVGVLSTSYDYPDERGKLRTISGDKWIDESTRDPVGMFQDMALMGTEGDDVEKGRDQVYGAIQHLSSEGSYNEGFYREDAALAVIVISDEDDQSAIKTVPQFVDWMLDLKFERERVSFSSIVGPEGGCNGAGGKAYEGTDYLRITREVGGIDWPICDGDWATVLEDLGVQVAGLQREFYLSAVPVEDTLTVWVDVDGEREDFTEGADFDYSRTRNSVRFRQYVPAGSGWRSVNSTSGTERHGSAESQRGIAVPRGSEGSR